MAVITKRKKTQFTSTTYHRSIDRCLDGISEAISDWDIDGSRDQREKAIIALNYWSKLNLQIVTRRNREELGIK